ncbi:hypothetical protein N790_04600 [Arenimonas malthae CC-JY-1]|uniref:Uncharacterized protein n=2 Tax=Arenimonas TaxID=490567 RepID=A0A091BJ74_9GAMM|nr:hypothetical protein N790_04600 [Arenimonas malthae CC-JY-1]
MSLGLVAGASQGAQALAGIGPAPVHESPGLLARAKAKACELSHAATIRTDEHAVADRKEECARRHGLGR